MEKNIYIVSLNGINNAGGVEKVSFYLNEILEQNYNVEIIKKTKINFGKLNNLLQPFFVSIKLFFLKNHFVIGNSWHCFLYPADISVHHGTSAGIMKNMETKSISLKIIAWMERISAKKAKKVLAVSENCKNELIELYNIPAEKIIVINNFVDDTVFFPSGNEKLKNKINICFSGALLEKKGLKKLIEISDYLEKYDDELEITLNIATNYTKNSEYFENKKNTKIQTGLNFTDMPIFYQNNDVLFFPTKYEGFSMATLEALSSGLCVVGSNFAVTPELELFPFCNKIDCNKSAEKIVEIIKTMYQEYFDKKDTIHEQIKNCFGKQQYIKKINELISNCIYL